MLSQKSLHFCKDKNKKSALFASQEKHSFYFSLSTIRLSSIDLLCLPFFLQSLFQGL